MSARTFSSRVRRIAVVAGSLTLSTAIAGVPAMAAGPHGAGSIHRVSVNASGGSPNGDSDEADIDGRGRMVAFASAGSDLIANDDNESADVFVRDRRTKETILVSAAPDGTVGNSESGSPSISADGQFVAFDSFSSDLSVNDTNGSDDVFVRDLVQGTTTIVSVALDGGPADSGSSNPSISPDGRYVAFQSAATNLVDGPDDPLTTDVFVRDLQTGMTFPVSVDVNGEAPDGESFAPSISRDGTRIAFWSNATDLVPGDENGFDDVFVRDFVAGTTERVSVAEDGSESDQMSREPDISADGTHVAFVSRANNLVPADSNGFVIDVFVRDLEADATVRASVDATGEDAGDNSEGPALNKDGSLVVFHSRARDLLPRRQHDVAQDVFVRDVAAGTTRLLTRDANGKASDGNSSDPAITLNGQFVAFASSAEDLVQGDDNRSSDLFVVRR